MGLSAPALRTSKMSTSRPAAELLKLKLAHPNQVLDPRESIDLLLYCLSYSQEHAQKSAGKDAVIVIGNTGAGKSTTVNYLVGCEMIEKSPRELGIKGISKLVVVKGTKDGGKKDEVMRIGHEKVSQTFVPEVTTDPDTGKTYIDCPGFLDNRGAEINIANAINVKTTISTANSVRMLILINFASLKADRGRGLTDMLKIAQDVMGGLDNLISNKESLLIGVTKTNSYDDGLDNLKDWLKDGTLEVMNTLADRVFMFDPLEREELLAMDRWDRSKILSEIGKLKPITNPVNMFSTVLTDEDQAHLTTMTSEMGKELTAALERREFAKAAECHKHLQMLDKIEHAEITRLLNTSNKLIEDHFEKALHATDSVIVSERFDEAADQLAAVQAASKHFEHLPGIANNVEHTLQQLNTAKANFAKREAVKAKLNADVKVAELGQAFAEGQNEAEREKAATAERERDAAMKKAAEDTELLKKEAQEAATKVAEEFEQERVADAINAEKEKSDLAKQLEEDHTKITNELAKNHDKILQEANAESELFIAKERQKAQDLEGRRDAFEKGLRWPHVRHCNATTLWKDELKGKAKPGEFVVEGATFLKAFAGTSAMLATEVVLCPFLGLAGTVIGASAANRAYNAVGQGNYWSCCGCTKKDSNLCAGPVSGTCNTCEKNYVWSPDFMVECSDCIETGLW